ncbi:hypothetical protein CRYUN_Cryun20dG0125300 [Craigia yunnanensis]
MVMLSTNESEKITSKVSNNSNGTSSPRPDDHKAQNGNSDLHETLVEELKANLKKRCFCKSIDVPFGISF